MKIVFIIFIIIESILSLHGLYFVIRLLISCINLPNKKDKEKK